MPCTSRYRCKFRGQCRIFRAESRCRACRFDRCILMGMNPRAMLLPFDHAEMRQLLLQFGKRRKNLVDSMQQWHYQRIKNERQLLTFEQSAQECQLQSLVYGEQKLKWLRESSFCDSLSDSFYALRLVDLIEADDNILAKAERFHKQPDWPKCWKELEADFEQNGFFQKENSESEMKPLKPRKNHFIMLDIYLSLSLMKTLPFFHQLDRHDQESLVKHILLAGSMLMEAFYSVEMRSPETLMTPDGTMPILLGKYVVKSELIEPSASETIKELKAAVFTHSMVPFQRVPLSMEEFALLRAIIFCHFSTPNISEHGQNLLAKECDKYSKILLRRLQSLAGEADGAKKYAEIIALVDALLRSAKVNQQFHVYVQNVIGFNPFRDPPFYHTIMYY